jgi:hypothetical protein
MFSVHLKDYKTKNDYLKKISNFKIIFFMLFIFFNFYNGLSFELIVISLFTYTLCYFTIEYLLISNISNYWNLKYKTIDGLEYTILLKEATTLHFQNGLLSHHKHSAIDDFHTNLFGEVLFYYQGDIIKAENKKEFENKVKVISSLNYF